MTANDNILIELAGLALTAGEDAAGGMKWIEVAHSGDFVKAINGNDVSFQLNARVFGEIVANFKRLPEQQRRLRVDFEHCSEPGRAPESFALTGVPAQGWLHDLQVRGDKLFALAEWLEPAKTLIQEKRYQYCSPAIRMNPAWNDGIRRGARMSSLALTNDPFLDRLHAIAASNGNPGGAPTNQGTGMTPEEIAAMKLENATLKKENETQRGTIADLTLSRNDLNVAKGKLETDLAATTKSHGELLLSTRNARVEEAFETYKDDKKLVTEDKEAMGLLLTHNATSFEARYPRLTKEKSALLRRQVKAPSEAGPNAEEQIEMNGGAGTDDALLAMSFGEHVNAVQKREKCSRNRAYDLAHAARSAAASRK